MDNFGLTCSGQTVFLLRFLLAEPRYPVNRGLRNTAMPFAFCRGGKYAERYLRSSDAQPAENASYGFGQPRHGFPHQQFPAQPAQTPPNKARISNPHFRAGIF